MPSLVLHMHELKQDTGNEKLKHVEQNRMHEGSLVGVQ